MNNFAASIVELIDSVYNPRAVQPENARGNNVELKVNEEKFAMPEFQALWSKINVKSIYIVDFDIDELIRNAIASLDAKLIVAKIFFKIESGAVEETKLTRKDVIAILRGIKKTVFNQFKDNP